MFLTLWAPLQSHSDSILPVHGPGTRGLGPAGMEPGAPGAQKPSRGDEPSGGPLGAACRQGLGPLASLDRA